MLTSRSGHLCLVAVLRSTLALETCSHGGPASESLCRQSQVGCPLTASGGCSQVSLVSSTNIGSQLAVKTMAVFTGAAFVLPSEC